MKKQNNAVATQDKPEFETSQEFIDYMLSWDIEAHQAKMKEQSDKSLAYKKELEQHKHRFPEPLSVYLEKQAIHAKLAKKYGVFESKKFSDYDNNPNVTEYLKGVAILDETTGYAPQSGLGVYFGQVEHGVVYFGAGNIRSKPFTDDISVTLPLLRSTKVFSNVHTTEISSWVRKMNTQYLGKLVALWCGYSADAMEYIPREVIVQKAFRYIESIQTVAYETTHHPKGEAMVVMNGLLMRFSEFVRITETAHPEYIGEEEFEYLLSFGKKRKGRKSSSKGLPIRNINDVTLANNPANLYPYHFELLARVHGGEKLGAVVKSMRKEYGFEISSQWANQFCRRNNSTMIWQAFDNASFWFDNMPK